jgi:hypothetical protein
MAVSLCAPRGKTRKISPATFTKNHEIALHNAESLQNRIPHWTRRSSSSILFLSLFQSLATGHVGVSRYLAWIVRHGSSKPKAEQP